MGKELVLNDGKYLRLVADLNKMIKEGRAKAQSAANREYMGTYWRIGRRLAEERLTETAGYGESVMAKLGIDLNTDRTTLVRCLQFHRDYPKGVPEGTTLSWSHFRSLVAIKDNKARAFYERMAEEKEWTQEELARAIHEDYHGQMDDPSKDFKPPKRLERPKGGPFVYRAEVIRTIDGDTILTRLDLGFDVWKKEYIRFAKLDAPALGTDGGEEAKKYVQEQLAKAKSVVVSTDKRDSHGRYVGYIFYSTDERDSWEKVFRSGRFLNDELLQKGLARVY